MKEFAINQILRAPEEENGSAGGTPAAAVSPNQAPDLTKLFETLTQQMNARMDGIDKKLADNNSAIDKRLNNVLTDLTEGLSVLSPAPAPVPAAVAQPPQAQTPPPPPPVQQEESGLQKVIMQRRLRDMEERDKANQLLLEETRREMLLTKIESAVAQGMSGKTWADAEVIDMVSKQMAQKAAIDPTDGKVKINGKDPKVHIETYWEANRWAQPAPTNSGSGNAGSQRRPDGSVDLSNYNPAKATPEDLGKLVEQTRKQFGM